MATPQVIQLQPTQVVNNLPPPPGGIQIVQQIVGPNGEIQQFPIQSAFCTLAGERRLLNSAEFLEDSQSRVVQV